jgi:flagellar motor switch protein FliN/FliY
VGLDSLVFRNVQVALRAQLGEVSMSVEELLALKSGAILQLDRALGEPVELFLNDALVARGEIVAVDDNFAVRLVEIAPA